jgi:hypothetical protein
MSIGVTLSDLREDLRSELGHSQTAGTGTSAEAQLNYMLRRAQKQLWQEFEWPDKVGHDHITMGSGQNFYPIPAGFDSDGIREVYYRSGTDLTRLEWSVPIRDRMDSDFDALPPASSEFPPTRWRIWTYAPPLPATMIVDGIAYPDPNDGTPFDYGEQLLELFPIPSFSTTETDNIVIWGDRTLLPLVSDTDVCTLDGVAIVLRAAAELALKAGAKNAQLKMQAANSYTNKIVTRGHKGPKAFILGGGVDPNDYTVRHGPDFSFLRR